MVKKSQRSPVVASPSLLEIQRLVATALFRPLNAEWKMQRTTRDGCRVSDLANALIKPNDRLNAFERLEIYNRQYWFRLLDCLYDDYPGVRRVLGERRFLEVATAYLIRYPSRSYSLRDLGGRLERFLKGLGHEPEWAEEGERLVMAQEMARFEWAQIVAFDGPSAPAFAPEALLDRPPSELRLGLQPYLSLLALRYAVDDFSAAIKREGALRGEASQAKEAAPKREQEHDGAGGLPWRGKVWLAVHRCDNVVYFKRLEPEAYALLRALQRGATLEAACEKAVLRSRRKGVDWAAQIGEWFSCWAQLGWLTA